MKVFSPKARIEIEIHLGDEPCLLHFGKGIYLPNFRALLVSDLHLGKVGYYQSKGIGIPAGADDVTLEKLQKMIEYYQPEEVIVLGDLFHHRNNRAFGNWRNFVQANPGMKFKLIKGNHDPNDNCFIEGKFYSVFHRYLMGQLCLSHEPENISMDNQTFNVCGHIHPGIKLKGLAKQTLKLPCFYLKDRQLILPALGDFTGIHLLDPNQAKKIFLVTDTSIMEYTT